MNTEITQNVDRLREWLIINDYDALIIPHEDEYLGEYLPEQNERLQWASGFTGSAGAAIITRTKAAIFVDGRYTVQVKNQVSSEVFEYRHLVTEPYIDWINANIESITNIAYDPRMHSTSWLNDVTLSLHPNLNLIPISQNPIDLLWTDRPSAKQSKVRLIPNVTSGQSSESKRKQVGNILGKKGIDAAILTRLDTICWLLNIRGLDIPRLPVLLSHAILYSDSRLDFFISTDCKSEAFDTHVGNGVKVLPSHQISDSIKSLSNKSVLLDSHSTNAWFKLEMEKSSIKIVHDADPCLLLKASKNESEIEGMKASHIVDGVAMVKFLHWLDTEVSNGTLHDEAIISDKLQAFREQDSNLVDLSFDTISAAGSNAAMCHYNHNDQHKASVLPEDSLYLVDSGGQYQNGTTDITRTVAIGTPSDEMRRLFTLVLKGHIALSSAIFPKGTTGSQLDVLARQHLWANGFDYDHGTGHGVGHFLSVHEGPQSISKKPNLIALEAGMVVSNEPGYYRADHFGIRIENLELIVEKQTNGDFSGLGFQALTLCPIDNRNIDVDLLTKPELRWLNQYHNKVWDTLEPLLDSEHKIWLKQATRTLSHN